MGIIRPMPTPTWDWNLHRLRILEAVARHGSVTRAAEELRIAQPAVSHQLRALEREVGAPLVVRRGRGIELTPAGVTVAAGARAILDRLSDVGRELIDLEGGVRGSIVIAADSTSGVFVVPPALGAFHRAHPKVEIRLIIANRAGVIDALAARTCDLAVMADPPADPPVEVAPFLADRIVLIGAPDNPLVLRTADPATPPASVDELAAARFLVREPGSGTRRALERWFARRNRTLPVGFELGDGEAVVQAVRANLGIAAISRWAIDLELESNRLGLIRAEGFPIERAWSLVHLRDRPLSAAGAACRTFLLAESRRMTPPA